MGNATSEPRLKEFSVVYTGAALNLMANEFVGVMQDINSTLKECYTAQKACLIPGSGTSAMEAVARQFVTPESSWFFVCLFGLLLF
jgi:aspartate aminotransferase-like enzyme